jgi:hypothetical protein
VNINQQCRVRQAVGNLPLRSLRIRSSTVGGARLPRSLAIAVALVDPL